MISPSTPSNVRTYTVSDVEQIIQEGLEALRLAPLNEKITAALRFLIPDGYRPVAQLEEAGRKKRNTASASNWNPATGEILIYFTPKDARALIAPVSPSQQPVSSLQAQVNDGVKIGPSRTEPDSLLAATSTTSQLGSLDGEVSEVQLEQLCCALATAEKAGKAFISLKWFRDTNLLAHGYDWAASVPFRQTVLTRAIDCGAVITSSISNPKAPQHPTTTVKLNRDSKYAAAVPPRFQPIRLKGGVSASEMILRDRGRI